MNYRKPMTIEGSFLGKIADRTLARVAREKAEVSPEEMRKRAKSSPTPRDFVAGFSLVGARSSAPAGSIHVIAEVKRASPSEGPIAPDADPVAIARAYIAAGARALSILTEPEFFGGDLSFISKIRAALPYALILRKDFMVDEYQIYQARAAGADAILLIAAMLEPEQLRAMHALALELGLAALIEVHDEAEMWSLDGVDARLVGVNNRDLKSLKVNLSTSERLQPSAPKGAKLIAESGLTSAQDLKRLRAAGFDGFLIGTAFMRAKDPGAALKALLDEAAR